MRQARYHRVLLKISGESLKGSAHYGIEPSAVNYLARQIGDAHSLGVEIAVVLGGGNIWRGAEAENQGMDRATAEQRDALRNEVFQLIAEGTFAIPVEKSYPLSDFNDALAHSMQPRFGKILFHGCSA